MPYITKMSLEFKHYHYVIKQIDNFIHIELSEYLTSKVYIYTEITGLKGGYTLCILD